MPPIVKTEAVLAIEMPLAAPPSMKCLPTSTRRCFRERTAVRGRSPAEFPRPSHRSVFGGRSLRLFSRELIDYLVFFESVLLLLTGRPTKGTARGLILAATTPDDPAASSVGHFNKLEPFVTQPALHCGELDSPRCNSRHASSPARFSARPCALRHIDSGGVLYGETILPITAERTRPRPCPSSVPANCDRGTGCASRNSSPQ